MEEKSNAESELKYLLSQFDFFYSKINNFLNYFTEYEKELNTKASKIAYDQEMLDIEIENFQQQFHVDINNKKIIDVNVGGQIFTTLLSTLTKIPDSMFNSMFSGRFPVIIDRYGRFFIDRDPSIFKYVLNGLRMHCWNIPENEEERKSLERELDYFCFVPINPCIQGTPLIGPLTINNIVVLGGNINGISVYNVECFNWRTLEWYQMDHMIESRFCFGACFYNGHIYAIGGDQNQQTCNSIESYNISLKKWTKYDNIPYIKSLCGISIVDETIYIIAGRKEWEHGPRSNNIYTYNIRKGKWRDFHAYLEISRSSFSTTVQNSKIYIIGGINKNNEVLKSVELVDTVKETCILYISLNIARFNLTSVNLNEMIYAIGGFDEFGNALNSVEMFNTTTYHWNMIQPMWNRRGWCTAIVVENLIQVFGGTSGFHSVKAVEYYDPAKEEWFCYTTMVTPRYGCALIVIR